MFTVRHYFTHARRWAPRERETSPAPGRALKSTLISYENDFGSVLRATLAKTNIQTRRHKKLVAVFLSLAPFFMFLLIVSLRDWL
ncbi:MAG: hypothetical protein WDN06_02855 [Asticcacaulis sp.]